MFSYFGEHGDVTKDVNCKWCGRKLRKHWREVKGPHVFTWSDGYQGSAPQIIDDAPRVKIGEPMLGDYKDGHFCGLRCGYDFGRWFADNGKRLIPQPKKGARESG